MYAMCVGRVGRQALIGLVPAFMAVYHKLLTGFLEKTVAGHEMNEEAIAHIRRVRVHGGHVPCIRTVCLWLCVWVCVTVTVTVGVLNRSVCGCLINHMLCVTTADDRLQRPGRQAEPRPHCSSQVD